MLTHELGKDCPIVIAGNKCDIFEQTVEKEEVDQYARSKGIEHVHASALNGKNVDYIFTSLAESKLLLTSIKLILLIFNLEMTAKKAQ